MILLAMLIALAAKLVVIGLAGLAYYAWTRWKAAHADAAN